MRIGYIGFSVEMVRILCAWEKHKLCVCFCDVSKKNKELEIQCKKENIPLMYVENSEQILKNVSKIDEEPRYFIVYKTGIIIRQKLLEKYSFYNFHPGDLTTNRGAHPLVWTVLLGEPRATMSLHKMGKDIDAGPLLCEKNISVYAGDTPQSLEKRLERDIPSMLPEIEKFRTGKLQIPFSEKGEYRRRIKEEDYTINPEADSLDVMRRKIDSQREYSGAILKVNGKEYRCVSVEIMDVQLQTERVEKGALIYERSGEYYCFGIKVDQNAHDNEK